MLWLALHLPALSLEAFTATLAAGAGDGPVVLLDTHRITAANAAARRLGIRPGLKRATALALAPHVVLGQADPGRDAAALLPVAHRSLAFTPMVCLQPARPDGIVDTVLLEVRATLRLHGGLPSLLQRLEQALAPLGHALRIACAATAEGAAVLARVDPPPCCTDLESTREALARAPVWLFGPGREHWEAIQGMGLSVLADLLVLPRSGLARRFGPALLAEVDAALGQRPDPREAMVLPPSFESRLELFARADNTDQVLHGAAILVERLIAWLVARHARVRRFRLAMRHESRWLDPERSDRTAQATGLEIALAEPSRDRAHLLMLLKERLGRLQLPAPTLELGLMAEDIARGAPPTEELFPTAQSEHDGLLRLVERLQARLGSDRVRRLVAIDDHRPERATALVPAPPGGVRAMPAGRREALAAEFVSRPVWLQTPEPLDEAAAMPLLHGRALQLLSGPERIEAGWWDDGLIGRDYFVADAGGGALVWVYRERLPLSDADPGSGWYLHGRFG